MKKFDEDLNVAVFTTKFIFRDKFPILRVFHHGEDGAWEFIGDQDTTEDDYMIVSLEEMIKYDPSILDIADLPYGGEAYREAKNSTWKKRIT